jgi:hypothetical protein
VPSAPCAPRHVAVDNLVSNWAYMVMTALAWNLKAWYALLLPERAGDMPRRDANRNAPCCGWSSARSAITPRTCGAR